MKSGKHARISNAPRFIIITGFMGAGKTTVARGLAERLGYRLIDLDDLITTREGRRPQQMIDEEGEASFRAAETRVLREALASADPTVVALGGGAWTIAENRALIAAHDHVAIWLDAPFALCWERIRSAPEERPLARSEDDARRLYDERRAHYLLARVRVRVSETKDAGEIVTEIVDAVC